MPHHAPVFSRDLIYPLDLQQPLQPLSHPLGAVSAHRPEPTDPPNPGEPDLPSEPSREPREPGEPTAPPIGDPPPAPNEAPRISRHSPDAVSRMLH